MATSGVKPRTTAAQNAKRRPTPKAADKGGAGSGLRLWLFGLRTKLIVPYVLLTLLAAMVGTYVVTRLVASSVRERFINQLFEASRVAADGIVKQERTHLSNLRLMAFTDGVAEAIQARDSDALFNTLQPLVLNNGVEALTVVDLTGKGVMTLAKDPNSEDYRFSKDEDFSTFPLAANILQGAQDQIGDKFVGILDTSFGPYYFTSAPVTDANRALVGVIMVGTRLETLLLDLKNRVGGRGDQTFTDIFVLDVDGKMVATTLATPDEGFGALELDSKQVATLDPSVTRPVDLFKRRYQAVYSPLVIRQQQMGVLGVILPSNYVVDAEATSRYRLSAIFALGTVGIILLGYVLAQSIARPIMKLRRISQAVAAGDLSQISGLRRADEIGELAAAFDVMTFQLRRRTEQAARLYAETVRRNQDLAEANAKLQSAQQQLVQSEKLAAVGQLTAGIVHDVKNPLAVIKGLAEELREYKRMEPAAQEQLGVIRDNAARANTIVTDLLKFARQSTPEVKFQDLRETVNTAIRLTAYLARKANVQTIVDLPKTPVMTTYDATQLEQVLVNLVQNSVQAMPHGGTLRVNLSTADKAVAIAVQDTGVGIPPENLNRIFDPFFTTKPQGEGTGLGLSVSYGIVSRHGGEISVTSQVGKGSTFTVLLPMQQPVIPR